MKFLADMGLARSTVAFLRAQGYDAVHLRDEGLQRLDDDRIIEKARAEGRVIPTHDLDFSRIIALSQARLPSVITFRLRDTTSPGESLFAGGAHPLRGAVGNRCAGQCH